MYDPPIPILIGSALQDVIAAAQQGENSEEETTKGEQAEEDASSSSSVMGFDAPARRMKTKGQPSAASKPVVETKADKKRPRPGSPSSSRKASPQEKKKADVYLEPVQKALQLVKQLEPGSLWKGTVKESEAVARLKKLADAVAQMEQAAVSNPDDGRLVAESVTLAKEAEVLNTDTQQFLATLNKLKPNKEKVKLDALLQDSAFANDLTNALQVQNMDPESLSTILLALTARVAEAWA